MPHDQPLDRPAGGLAASDRTRVRLLIFDLDGVITSEQRYWETARLVLWQLLEGAAYLGLHGYFDPSTAAGVIADRLLYDLKARALNSNWDKTFLLASLHMLHAAQAASQAGIPDASDAVADLFGAEGDSAPFAGGLRRLGELLADGDPAARPTSAGGAALVARFLAETQGQVGAALLDALQPFAEGLASSPLPALTRRGTVWQFCYERFQAIFRGEAGDGWAPGGQNPLGLALQEQPIIDHAAMDVVLSQLGAAGYTLGVATGRPRDEATAPLQQFGLLAHFDPQRFVTYDEVRAAEALLAAEGQPAALGKPHPFVLFRAIYPEEALPQLFTRIRADAVSPTDRRFAAFIGDAASDMLAASAAQTLALGVLSDAGPDATLRAARRYELLQAGSDLVLDSLLDLPQVLGLAPR